MSTKMSQVYVCPGQRWSSCERWVKVKRCPGHRSVLNCAYLIISKFLRTHLWTSNKAANKIKFQFVHITKRSDGIESRENKIPVCSWTKGKIGLNLMKIKFQFVHELRGQIGLNLVKIKFQFVHKQRKRSDGIESYENKIPVCS